MASSSSTGPRHVYRKNAPKNASRPPVLFLATMATALLLALVAGDTNTGSGSGSFMASLTQSSSSSANSSTNSSTTSSLCENYADICFGNEVCLSCVPDTYGAGAATDDQSDGDDDEDDDEDDDSESSESSDGSTTCSSRYPSILETGTEFCERAGASFCCEFENNTVASACLDIPATTAYWDCFMADLGDHGCTVADMPCYYGFAPDKDTLVPTPTTTTTPTTAPTLAAQFVTASPHGNAYVVPDGYIYTHDDGDISFYVSPVDCCIAGFRADGVALHEQHRETYFLFRAGSLFPAPAADGGSTDATSAAAVARLSAGSGAPALGILVSGVLGLLLASAGAGVI